MNLSNHIKERLRWHHQSMRVLSLCRQNFFNYWKLFTKKQTLVSRHCFVNNSFNRLFKLQAIFAYGCYVSSDVYKTCQAATSRFFPVPHPCNVESEYIKWNEINYPQFVPGNTLQGSYWNAKIVLKSVRFSTCGLSWLSDVFLGTIALPT